jgi:hypothetical protein
VTVKALFPLLIDQLMVPSLVDKVAVAGDTITNHDGDQGTVHSGHHLMAIETLLALAVNEHVVSFSGFPRSIVVAPPAVILNECKGIGSRNYS